MLHMEVYCYARTADSYVQLVDGALVGQVQEREDGSGAGEVG